MTMINAVTVLLILLLQQPETLLAKSDTYDSTTADGTAKNTIKLIVKFKPTSSNSNDGNIRSFLTRSNNSGSVNQLLSTKVRAINGHLASVDVYPEDKDMVMNELKKDDNVLLVEEDFEIYKSPAIEEQKDEQQQYTTTTGNNLRRTLEEVEQYGNRLIQTNDILTTVSSHPNRYINTPVKVCIIDTGYNIDHEDLPKEAVTQTDVGYGSSFFDNDGHGTHCAGVIGAVGGNERGVVGVIPDENLFSFHIIKALNDEGIGTAFVMLRAIQGCIDNGSKIINMSIGSGFQSAIFREEFERAYDEGLLLVSASGNQGEGVYDYPASYKPVISVGAVDWHGNRAEFSNYNDQVELMAPGVSIKSTYTSDGYKKLSGTSMATPYVVGAFALVWGYFPTCSNQQIRNVFARTAKRTSHDPSGCDEKNGYGIIQAKAAFDALHQFGCEFGGEDSIPKSSDAFGGCQQIRSLTGKPTLAPTVPTLRPTEKTTSPSFALSTSKSPPNPITLSNTTWTSTVTSTHGTSFTVGPSINPTIRPSESPTNSLTYPPSTIPPTTYPLTSSPSNSVSLSAFATTLTSMSSSNLTTDEPTNEPTLSLPSSAASTNMPTTIGPTATASSNPSFNPTEQAILTDHKIISSNRYSAYLSSSSTSNCPILSPTLLHLATSLVLWHLMNL
eukprot:scaffold5909_cov150-Skeletonema_menzelii.AAC.13